METTLKTICDAIPVSDTGNISTQAKAILKGITGEDLTFQLGGQFSAYESNTSITTWPLLHVIGYVSNSYTRYARTGGTVFQAKVKGYSNKWFWPIGYAIVLNSIYVWNEVLNDYTVLAIVNNGTKHPTVATLDMSQINAIKNKEAWDRCVMPLDPDTLYTFVYRQSYSTNYTQPQTTVYFPTSTSIGGWNCSAVFSDITNMHHDSNVSVLHWRYSSGLNFATEDGSPYSKSISSNEFAGVPQGYLDTEDNDVSQFTYYFWYNYNSSNQQYELGSQSTTISYGKNSYWARLVSFE
jgi:hypothetical protein